MPPAGWEDRASALLLEHWGHGQLRPSQLSAIAAALDGRDCLVIAPTGAGKSVCYQLPPLLTGKPTVIVTPLVALMHDQVAGALSRGLSAVYLGGSQRDASAEARAAAGEFDLVYVTPEKLASGAFGTSLLARMLAPGGRGIGLLAVDEAHCVLSWGRDFRPSFLGLGAARPAGVPLMALTATAAPDARPALCRALRMAPDSVRVEAPLDRPNLQYVFRPKGSSAAASLLPLLHGADAALAELDSPAIVYVPTTAEADEIAAMLCRAGVKAAPFHARAAGKDEALRSFTRDSGVRFTTILLLTTLLH